jgi:hypothetical protein
MRITTTLNANGVNGIIRVNGEAMGAYWATSDGKWGVRVDGFPTAVVATRTAVRAFALSALS